MFNEEETQFDAQTIVSKMSPEAQKKRDKRAAYIAAKAVGIGKTTGYRGGAGRLSKNRIECLSKKTGKCRKNY